MYSEIFEIITWCIEEKAEMYSTVVSLLSQPIKTGTCCISRAAVRSKQSNHSLLYTLTRSCSSETGKHYFHDFYSRHYSCSILD